jgi:hypothetical protein
MPAAQQVTGINHVTQVDARPGLSRLTDDMTIVEDFAGTEDMSTCLFQVGFLVAGFREDVTKFISLTRGMPHMDSVPIDTGVRSTVIAGSLDQWRVAAIQGSKANNYHVRTAFNVVYSVLIQMGFSWLFDGYYPVEAAHDTFLLEHKK